MNRIHLKGNWPMMIGAIGMLIYFGIGHFVSLPDFLRGVLLGISIGGIILGAVVAKFGFERLCSWKKGLLQRQK